VTFENIFFDIGTTGKPKGVEVGSDADFFALDSKLYRRHIEIFQNQACFPEMNKGGKVLGFLPFYHIYGQSTLMLQVLRLIRIT
jgi:long-subunit acyl-CoA synthetase (AMP-forming)